MQQLIRVSIDNNFLNMTDLVKNIYQKNSDSYLGLEAVTENHKEFDHSYSRDKLYVVVARDNSELMNETLLQEEFISARINYRFVIFDILSSSMDLDQEHSDPISLSIAMDLRDTIDIYWENAFSQSFVGLGTDCAVYALDILSLFQEIIPEESLWAPLQEFNDYSQAAQSID